MQRGQRHKCGRSNTIPPFGAVYIERTLTNGDMLMTCRMCHEIWLVSQ